MGILWKTEAGKLSDFRIIFNFLIETLISNFASGNRLLESVYGNVTVRILGNTQITVNNIRAESTAACAGNGEGGEGKGGGAVRGLVRQGPDPHSHLPEPLRPRIPPLHMHEPAYFLQLELPQQYIDIRYVYGIRFA